MANTNLGSLEKFKNLQVFGPELMESLTGDTFDFTPDGEIGPTSIVTKRDNKGLTTTIKENPVSVLKAPGNADVVQDPKQPNVQTPTSTPVTTSTNTPPTTVPIQSMDTSGGAQPVRRLPKGVQNTLNDPLFWEYLGNAGSAFSQGKPAGEALNPAAWIKATRERDSNATLNRAVLSNIAGTLTSPSIDTITKGATQPENVSSQSASSPSSINPSQVGQALSGDFETANLGYIDPTQVLDYYENIEKTRHLTAQELQAQENAARAQAELEYKKKVGERAYADERATRKPGTPYTIVENGKTIIKQDFTDASGKVVDTRILGDAPTEGNINTNGKWFRLADGTSKFFKASEAVPEGAVSVDNPTMDAKEVKDTTKQVADAEYILTNQKDSKGKKIEPAALIGYADFVNKYGSKDYTWVYHPEVPKNPIFTAGRIEIPNPFTGKPAELVKVPNNQAGPEKYSYKAKVGDKFIYSTDGSNWYNEDWSPYK